LCAALAAVVIFIFVDARAQNLPLVFEQNRKQAPASVRFLTKTPAYQLHFKRTEVEVLFADRSLVIRFAGAHEKAKPEGFGRLDELIRYVHATRADEKQKVPTFALVRYEQLYPGIDLVFYGRRAEVRYEFVVAPENDPAQIRVVVDNADLVEVAEDGALAVKIGQEILHVRKLAAIQHDDEGRRTLDFRYKLLGSNEVSFEIDGYDPSLPLTIQ
jgi:hypothetical protein